MGLGLSIVSRQRRAPRPFCLVDCYGVNTLFMCCAIVAIVIVMVVLVIVCVCVLLLFVCAARRGMPEFSKALPTSLSQDPQMLRYWREPNVPWERRAPTGRFKWPKSYHHVHHTYTLNIQIHVMVHRCYLGVQGCGVSGCGVSNYWFQNPAPVSALGVMSPHPQFWGSMKYYVQTTCPQTPHPWTPELR